MYESHFGFSGPPFQINPDPAFLFESRNHSHALSYLRFGVQQGEGFIVVTGDIGAGKTTLVRALLEQLDPDQVVAAHLANTQLESVELLQCILTAFGVPAQGLTKGGLIANLEAFLTSVAASGRRALLVVDEAQNLSASALEELRMLSNFQIGNHALLQSFLVGQPELRTLLQGPSMEQLRQRVLASYHLGPLGVDDTAGYVRHRLEHVGWCGRPAFGDAAMRMLHASTGGVPRRLNQLCNRVLLAACLGGHETVTSALVRQMALELQQEMVLPLAELPEAEPEPAPERVAPVPPEPVSAREASDAGHAAPTPGAHGADEVPRTPDNTASAQELALRFDADTRPVHERGDDSRAHVRDRAEPGSGVPLAGAAPLAPPTAATPAASPVLLPEMPPIMSVTDGIEFDIDLDEVDGPTPPPASPSSHPEWASLDLELEPAFAPVDAQDAERLPTAAPPSRRDTLVLLHGDRPNDEPPPASGRPTLLALGDSALACAKLRRLSLCWQQVGQTVPVRVLFAGSTAEWSAQGASAGADRADLAPDACVAASERGDPTGPWRRLLQDGTAHAVVVAGASWPLLHAVLAARQAGVPVVRLGAGESRVDADSERSLLNTLLDRASSWLCCTGVAEHQVLIREGVPARRIARVGNLAAGVLQGLAPSVPDFPAVLGGLQLPALWLARAASGFGLVTAQVRPSDVEPEDALQWLMLARLGHAEMPLLWLADEATLAALRDPTLQLQVESSGIAIVPQLSYLGQLSLLSRARCVLAGPAGALADEAGAMGVPVVLVQLSGGSGMALEGGGLTLVGPSAAQLRAAVRAAHQQHRAAGALLELDDDAATETAQQLARWLGPAGARVVGPEEAVA